MQLWHHIRTSVNPSTKVGACALKEKIKPASLEKFGHDIKAYNVWLSDTRKDIIKQEGTVNYNEYIQYMFKTYLSSKNSEFNETIKAIKRNWTQDLLDKYYSHTDLMSTATKTYNNIVADGGWELADKTTDSSQKGGTYMQAKFLVLTVQVEALTKGNGRGTRTKGSEEVRRYLNPENKAYLTRGNRKYKWCMKNCHKKPMWCGRPNCLSGEEFTAKKKGE